MLVIVLYYLMAKVKLLLSPLSSGWLFWYANHTSIYKNSELNVFKDMKFVVAISTKLPNGLFGTNIYKSFESCLIIIVDNVTMN